MIGEDEKTMKPSIRFEFNSSQIYTWSRSFVVSLKPPAHVNRTQFVRQITNNWRCGFIMSRKYKFELKRNAVEHYLSTSDSFKLTAQKYQVSISLLKEWVARTREQGIESLNSKCTRYDIQFKMEVLNFMNNTGASPLQAAAMFNVPSPRTVRKWRSMLESQGIDALRKTSKGYSTVKKKQAIAPKKKQNINSKNDLQKEIEYLRMENAYLKKLHALIQQKQQSLKKTKHT
jgi:transposase-like protein